MSLLRIDFTLMTMIVVVSLTKWEQDQVVFYIGLRCFESYTVF